MTERDNELQEEEVIRMLRDYYRDILERDCSQQEIINWLARVNKSGYSHETMESIRNSLLNSPEHRNLLVKSLPIFESSHCSKSIRIKVAILSTSKESTLVYLMLTHLDVFKEVEVICFIDDPESATDDAILPIKTWNEANTQIDRVVILKKNSYIKDPIVMNKNFKQIYKKLVAVDYMNKIILPSPKYGKFDRKQWNLILGKEIVLYCDSEIKDSLTQMFSFLNEVCHRAFCDEVIISHINTLDNEELKIPGLGQKAVIAQDDYSESLTRLINSGVEFENILLLSFEGSFNNLSDMFLRELEIFVYTMSKVGTTSFQVSLIECGLNSVQAHSVHREPELKHLIECLHYDLENQYIFWKWHIRMMTIKHVLETHLKRHHLHVISGVREPIQRLLSDYFQMYEAACKSNLRVIASNAGELYTEIIGHVKWIMQGGDWFTQELKPNLHIDVYDHPFDHAKGYQIIDENNVRLLIVRLENLNDVWEKAVVEWLGEERLPNGPPPLIKANEASSKSIADLYNEVKSTIKFDPELIEEVYSSRQAKHFYTEEELNQFKQKWLNR